MRGWCCRFKPAFPRARRSSWWRRCCMSARCCSAASAAWSGSCSPAGISRRSVVHELGSLIPGATSPLVGEHRPPPAAVVGKERRSDASAMSHRRCDPGEGLRPIDRPEPLTPTLSHKGRGIFSDYRFSYFISIRCLTRKCGIYARLHIGNKIGPVESWPDAGIETNQAETVGSSRRGSDIDLFGYSKSIINLDAKVAHRAVDLGVAKQELYGS